MTLNPQARRLALLGVALTLTLTSAGWLFFGAHAEEPTVVATPAKATPAKPAPAPAPVANAAAATPAATPAKAAAPIAKPAAKPTVKTAAVATGAAAAPTPVRPAVRAVRRDTTPTTATIEREVFAYGGSGRRDPFRALISTSVIRPMPSELRLVAVVYDPRGAGSVAILRDSTTKKQHRVRPGQLLGRMRVAQIRQKHVVFTIEELGFSRQEILGLQDSTATRLP